MTAKAQALDTGLRLAPARVTAADAGALRVRLDGADRDAVLAVAGGYQPVAGDTVLVAAQEGAAYVIGVIAASGPTVFTAPGDVAFRAPSGRIEFQAAQGLRLSGPEVEIKTARLALTARTLVETVDHAYRWVKRALRLRAGRVRETVEGDYRLDAERITERAKGRVAIDGASIDLG